MYATFNNRFEIVENYEGKQRIKYKHGLRCPLEMYIEKLKPQTNPDLPPPDRDWEIVMEGGNKALINEFKAKLAGDLAWYLKRRSKKGASQLAYQELEKLAGIRSIH